MMSNHDRRTTTFTASASASASLTIRNVMLGLFILTLVTGGTRNGCVEAFSLSPIGGRIRTKNFCVPPQGLVAHVRTSSSSLSPTSASSLTMAYDEHGIEYKDEESLVVPPTIDTVQGVHPLLRKEFPSKVNEVKHWLQQRLSSFSFSQSRHKVTSAVMAALIMLTVMFAPLSDALAAPSGGRMGGSFGGSSRSSSRSYSSPSRSSSSYGRGFSRGYSTGYYSRPSVTVAPILTPSYNYGYNYGPGGVTVVRRGPSVVDVLIFGVAAAVMYNAFTSSITDNDTDNDNVMSVLGPGVSVAKISVALNVSDRDDPSSILSFLNRLSRTARTDSRVGVSDLVSQVSLELLRQRHSAFAAGSKCTHHRNSNKASRDFSSLAIQERSKFETEDISNYGGVEYGVRSNNDRKKMTGNSSPFSPKATSAVVTIILSIDGDSTKIPTINSVADLERALTQIASDVKVDGCLRSAEVLWTPQSSNDTLDQRDIIVDYPDLRSV